MMMVGSGCIFLTAGEKIRVGSTFFVDLASTTDRRSHRVCNIAFILLASLLQGQEGSSLLGYDRYVDSIDG
jgi:hypothetical protein